MEFIVIDEDAAVNLVTCYGSIARLCDKHCAIFKIVTKLHVYWQQYWDKEHFRPGLSHILFALEHITANCTSTVRAVCEPIWRQMMSSNSLSEYVYDHVVTPISQRCSAFDFPFEAHVLLVNAIVSTFDINFNIAHKYKRWTTVPNIPAEMKLPCAIVNCVCQMSQHWTVHSCQKACNLLKSILDEECERETASPQEDIGVKSQPSRGDQDSGLAQDDEHATNSAEHLKEQQPKESQTPISCTTNKKQQRPKRIRITDQ